MGTTADAILFEILEELRIIRKKIVPEYEAEEEGED